LPDSHHLCCAGGGKEVNKLRDQKYRLLWKDGDFVRLAARCNALIIPFAAVGGDDAFDLFLDTQEVLGLLISFDAQWSGVVIYL
jgi:hypothetical protein